LIELELELLFLLVPPLFAGPSVVHGLVKVLWEILTKEQLDAQTINSLVIPMVDIIYGYAECLSLQHAGDSGVAGSSVSPAVALLQKLLFAPSEPVRTSCRYYFYLSFHFFQICILISLKGLNLVSLFSSTFIVWVFPFLPFFSLPLFCIIPCWVFGSWPGKSKSLYESSD
jgi:hypothetical protein